MTQEIFALLGALSAVVAAFVTFMTVRRLHRAEAELRRLLMERTLESVRKITADLKTDPPSPMSVARAQSFVDTLAMQLDDEAKHALSSALHEPSVRARAAYLGKLLAL